MTGDLHGLDKLGARRRRVTPPRRPAAGPTAARAAASQPAADPPARAGDVTPDPTPQVRTPAGAPMVEAGGATQQLGVRLHGYQIRRLRRLVHLLAEDEDLRRPTQAEIVQVLVDSLPDEPGPELTGLAGLIRDYRRRQID